MGLGVINEGCSYAMRDLASGFINLLLFFKKMISWEGLFQNSKFWSEKQWRILWQDLLLDKLLWMRVYFDRCLYTENKFGNYSEKAHLCTLKKVSDILPHTFSILPYKRINRPKFFLLPCTHNDPPPQKKLAMALCRKFSLFISIPGKGVISTCYIYVWWAAAKGTGAHGQRAKRKPCA